MQDNPLKYATEHLKQKEATASQKSIRALIWGNRVGKTEWGAQESVRFVTGEHPFRTIEIPNEGWACSPSYDLQLDGNQKKLEKYLSKSLIEHVDYLRGAIWKSVRLKNGSLITFKSYEQGREKFQSAGKRWIWFDEEPSSDIWTECMMRQEAGVPLDVWLTMTPVNGMTWVYDDLYLDTSNPHLFVSEAGWEDNPFLLADQKEQMLSQLKTDESVEVRSKGHFVNRVGLVCSWWRREKHMREYLSLPKDWSYYESFDGGWSDPATWLLLGIDPLNNLHIVDGFKEDQLLTEEIKERRDARIKGLLMRGGYSDNDNPRLNEELNRLGMNLSPVEKKPGESKSWDETMTESMASFGKIEKGTGEPRLYINQNLSWLIQQIENLKWLELKHKEGTEITPKWNDHRKFKHHFDGIFALAYFTVSYQKPISNQSIRNLPQFQTVVDSDLGI